MKNIVEMTVLHIISEPGDCTRYDYLMVPGEETYRFYPFGNEFNYPTEIGVWQTEEAIDWLASKYNCNPHTVAECLRSMKGVNDATSER